MSYGEFYLGAVGREILLPAVIDYREDPVRQGSNHILLSGMMAEDRFGVRTHFYFKWRGIDNDELDVIAHAIHSANELSLLTHRASRILQVIDSEETSGDGTGYEPWRAYDSDLGTDWQGADNLGQMAVQLVDGGYSEAVEFYLPNAATGLVVKGSTADTFPTFGGSWTTLVASANYPVGWSQVTYTEGEYRWIWLEFTHATEDRALTELWVMSTRWMVVLANNEPIRHNPSGENYELTLEMDQSRQ